MSENNHINIDGVEYVRADAMSDHEGDYYLVVLDRGWIFHGRRDPNPDGLGPAGVCVLRDCVNVRKWDRGGFGGLTKSPNNSGAVLDPCDSVYYARPIFEVKTSPTWRDS